MDVDTRGEVCPYPMMKAVEAMKKGKKEEVVVITDHEPALETIPPQAMRLGFTYRIDKIGSPEWKITLTPKG